MMKCSGWRIRACGEMIGFICSGVGAWSLVPCVILRVSREELTNFATDCCDFGI